MKARIVPAEPSHAEAIAANARDADRAELWAASRGNPLDAMLQGINGTPASWTGLYEGEPACMFGAWPFSALGGMGAAWMIGSRVLERHGAQRDLLRLSRPVVDYMRDQYPTLLYNFVDERNTSAIRWLRWLGFEFAEAIPYGVDGLPFLPFYMKKVAT